MHRTTLRWSSTLVWYAGRVAWCGATGCVRLRAPVFAACNLEVHGAALLWPGPLAGSSKVLVTDVAMPPLTRWLARWIYRRT